MMNEHLESQQQSKRLAWLGQVFSMPDHRLSKKLVSGEVIHLSSQVVTLMLHDAILNTDIEQALHCCTTGRTARRVPVSS